MKEVVENIQELRDENAQTLAKLKNGEITDIVAKRMISLTGRIHDGLTIQLKYAKLRKEEPNIPFLNIKAAK